MKLYLVENSLFHLCGARYEELHSFYTKCEDYYICNSMTGCKIKFPSLLAVGSELNKLIFFTKDYFEKTYPNCPYIEI